MVAKVYFAKGRKKELHFTLNRITNAVISDLIELRQTEILTRYEVKPAKSGHCKKVYFNNITLLKSKSGREFLTN